MPDLHEPSIEEISEWIADIARNHIDTHPPRPERLLEVLAAIGRATARLAAAHREIDCVTEFNAALAAELRRQEERA